MRCAGCQRRGWAGWKRRWRTSPHRPATGSSWGWKFAFENGGTSGSPRA
jgi:hypothetical protein